MENFVIYLILIFLSAAFSVKTQKKLGVSFFVIIATISIIQFVLGIVHLLNFGVFISFGAFLCFIYLLNYFRKNKNLKSYLKENIFDILFFSIIYIVVHIVFYGFKVASHNELAHWAILVKKMLFFNTLPTPEFNLVYVGYPPIVGMWEFWFSNFFNTFEDKYLFVSNALLQISLVFGTVRLLNKNFIQSLFITIFALLVLFLVGNIAITTLFVDIIIALVFVFVAIYIYKMERMNKIDFFILGISLIFLSLVKEIGILFAIIALFYLLIMQFKNFKNEFKKLIMIVLSLLLIVILFKNIWNLYLEFYNLNQAWDASCSSLSNICKFITGNGEEYQYEVVSKYFSEVIGASNYEILGLKVSQIGTFLGTLVILFAIFIFTKDKKILKSMIMIFVLNLIYILGLLFLYLFSFAKWEAEVILAYERYVQIINTINVMFVLLILMDKIKYVIIPSILLAIVVIFSFGEDSRLVTFKEDRDNNIEVIKRYSGIDKYYDMFDLEDKIYVITEFENPILREYVMLHIRYRIVPYNAYISESEDITLEEIKAKLMCGYTYVYMYNCTNKNLEKYQTFLTDKEIPFLNGYLFEIKYDENNNLLLEKVDV